MRALGLMRRVSHPPRGATVAVSLLLLLLVLCLPTNVNGFLFKLASGSSRCFSQEIPSNTNLRLVYQADEAFGDFLDATLANADGASVYTKAGSDSGVFVEHIVKGGEYTFCLTSRRGSKSLKTSRNVLLQIQTGADTNEYSSVATKEKMRPMEWQIRMMEDTVEEVHNEFLYLKDREAEMRSTNEHMTALVMWMSIGLILLFGLFWYLQMRHLKRYFKKKRMID